MLKKTLEVLANIENKEGKIAIDQAVKTAPTKRRLVRMSWYLYMYFIAIYRSILINVKCCIEAIPGIPDVMGRSPQKPDAKLPAPVRRYI